MSYKLSFTCMKVTLLGISLLFFQTVFGQYDFSGVDQLLTKNQKILGNNVVALYGRTGKSFTRKSWVKNLMQRHRRR